MALDSTLNLRTIPIKFIRAKVLADGRRHGPELPSLTMRQLGTKGQSDSFELPRIDNSRTTTAFDKNAHGRSRFEIIIVCRDIDSDQVAVYASQERRKIRGIFRNR